MAKVSVFNWFNNVSIARKLYFTVGIMALLIGVELVALFFSINTLSAVRAYVEGEGLWSKAQKDALYHLQRYASYRNEEDYKQFKEYMKVPMGDAKARAELGKVDFDMEKARQGFIEGRNHPEDVDGMIHLFRRFNKIYYIGEAIRIWGEAEPVAMEMMKIAERLHNEIKSPNVSQERIDAIMAEIEPLNKELTKLEDDFSYTLGEGSRWLEKVVLRLLFAIALTVEITGLLLAISVSRGIRKGLTEILNAAKAFATGNFKTKAKVFSQDEIGELAISFNQMSEQLENSIHELEQAEKKFRGLLESAPDAIVIVDGEGVIKLVNAESERMFGFNRDELIGNRIELLIPFNLADLLQLYRAEYLKNPEVSHISGGMQLPGRKKGGAEFPVDISFSPLHTEGGLLVSVAIRDITERKKAEAELRRYTHELEVRNKELGQFAYVASHDLQEPLRSVTSFVELIERDYGHLLDGKGKDYMRFIIASSRRMKDQIHALLDYTRIGRHRMPQPVDTEKLLREVQEDMSAAIKHSGAVIEVETLPELTAYPVELKLLFQNLLSNAIKFRKNGNVPHIKVGAEKTQAAWRFYVQDDGIGIEERFLQKIFIIFQRLHTRDEYPGTGIGLAHCKKIAELHGGDIWAESEIGKGSVFYFTLPFDVNS